MDTPSPGPLSSPLQGEEEKPLALLPPVPWGRQGQPPGGAPSCHQKLKSSLPRKRGRPKSGPELPLAQGLPAAAVDSGSSGGDHSDLLLPLAQGLPAVAVDSGSSGGDHSDLLLIDDQGVPYTVSEGLLSAGAQVSSPRRAPHFCLVCLRAFPYLSDLERHSISHSELKPHECKDCGKTFKRSSHLRRHCNIHAGLRPFLCALCPRRFREAGELAHHHRVHSGERPYQCPVCRLRFTEANTLRRHSKRKHPETLGLPICHPDPRPEPLWDDEGIPATEGVHEEGPQGNEPA